MQLPLEDVELFFRLHRSLMFFVNQQLNVIDEKVSTPDAYSVLPPTNRIGAHNESYKEAKERFGIVTSLPMQEGRPHPTKKKTITKERAITARTTCSGSTTSAVH